MRIRKATRTDLKKSLDIAKDLKEWFTKEAIENMKVDFIVNNTIVAIDKNNFVGFLCYCSDNGAIKILWLGVDKKYWRRGIGGLLINWLIKEAKKLKSDKLEVETLTEEDEYEPYKLTRAFYKKCGFRKTYVKKASKSGWDDVDVMEKKL